MGLLEHKPMPKTHDPSQHPNVETQGEFGLGQAHISEHHRKGIALIGTTEIVTHENL